MSPRQPQRRAAPARQRGLTLVELMMTLGITAVLMSIAVPSMVTFIARKRVANVANELASDLRYLRSVGLQRSAPMQIEFNANAAVNCYVVASDSITGGAQTCDCRLAAACGADPGAPAVIKTVSLALGDGITLSAVPVKTVFGSNGLPAGGATLLATVQSARGGTVRVFTNQVGRPFVCSVAGQETNFPACS